MSKVYRYVLKMTGSTAIARTFDFIFRFSLSFVTFFLKTTHVSRNKPIDKMALENEIEKIRPNGQLGPQPLTCKNSDDNITLSIIVPVFNSEKYLTKCIDSITTQKTSFMYELIIVDDGSTDDSAALLDKYTNHFQLKIIRTINNGVAAARNEGIRHASGKYVMFVDADDYLPENCVETLLSRAIRDTVDIVQGSYWVVDVDDNVSRTQVFNETVSAHADPDTQTLSGYPWGKVIRRDLFRSVQFPEGMAYEDTIFVFVLLPLAKGYASLPQPVYYYRSNPAGLTAGLIKNPKSLDAYWIVPKLLAHRRSIGMPIDNNIFKEVKKHFGALLYSRLANFDDEIKKTVFDLCCLQVATLRGERSNAPPDDKGDELDCAFRTRNYALWKLLCFFEL
ncbi:glycosyltransferase family 2 protein [Paraburkholderia sediminicola]|uniref:glycosyltransferase family 2 protein n=1 Tax=Paraburkholderia sediminicola TaxID=458836 RepID=UPI0038BDE54E